MARLCLVFHVVSTFALLWTAAAAQTPIDCTRNREQTRWFVRAGAPGEGAGTNARPFASLADVERCAPAGATIIVLAPADSAPPLDGGIRLKDRQKLFGAAPERGGKPAARLTNTGSPGDAITLAHGNEIAHLHIDTPAGAAILGDNVDGVLLRDLLLTRQSATPPSTLDASLCQVVRAGDVVDNARSTLRGCTGGQTPAVKAAVVLLADDGVGSAAVRYGLQRVVIQGDPSPEKPATSWPAGISVIVAGRARVTLDVQDSSIEYTTRGLGLRGVDHGVLTANLTNMRLDSLRSDGIGVVAGFTCSGLDKATKTPFMNCEKLAPAPVSEAHVVLNADGLRFTDTQRRGQPNDAAAIEVIASDQGRSTLEVHVTRSDIIGAAAAGVFTYYFIGRPGRDVIDLGCLNPDPDRTSPDRDACRKLGYTSAGQNRIFGNMRNSKNISPYVEVGLQGPGLMMAQGNYWGDINPVDGKGDALGECGVFDWSGETRDETPVKPLPEARCDLYNIRPQGNPTGVDGRFHLASDPRPAKK